MELVCVGSHAVWDGNKRLEELSGLESPFATARLRTDAAKRFKRVENATAILWRMLLVAESRFRRLKHPDLLDAVYRGVKYVDGVPARTKAAA